MVPIVLIASVLGASLGSFVAASAYRIPLGISLLRTWSFCPGCFQRIRTFDLIPIASYIILGGRCRACKNPIPKQFLAVEVFSLFLAILGSLQHDLTVWFVALLLFSLLMVLVGLIDWQCLVIPNELILVGIFIGLVSSLLEVIDIGSAIFSAIVATLMMTLIRTIGNRFFKRESVGWGDVKLCGVIAIFLGLELFLLSLWFAAVGGSLYGFYHQISSKARFACGTVLIPFGSFLAGAAVLCALFKGQIEAIALQWLTSTP